MTSPPFRMGIIGAGLLLAITAATLSIADFRARLEGAPVQPSTIEEKTPAENPPEKIVAVPVVIKATKPPASPALAPTPQPSSPPQTLPERQKLTEIKKQIEAPPPLKTTTAPKDTTLTQFGVIEWTNIQRANENLLPLTEHALLNQAAAGKLKDMFDHQYFAHVSPAGIGPSFWVEQSAYSYKLVGENLALGNFGSDQALVQAWMNSPGHRENIMKPAYEHIGVAVGKGLFEGKETWLAVQVFGDPMPACDKPSNALFMDIEEMQEDLDLLTKELKAAEAELKQTQKNDPSYNDTVASYNALVEPYNAKINELKALTTSYNTEVNQYNACIAQ